jgi:hypothetical protein
MGEGQGYANSYPNRREPFIQGLLNQIVPGASHPFSG